MLVVASPNIVKVKHAEGEEEEAEYRRVIINSVLWATFQSARFFETVAKGQTPDFLYIGCSDSRVCPKEMTGLSVGELFVHRNIANLVCPTNYNVNAVINYAVKALKVRHIIVCGHYNCGGVMHAFGPVKDLVLDAWISQIREVYRLHAEDIDRFERIKDKRKALVRWNVYEQCRNVLKNPVVQEELANLKVHGWVFNLKNGQIIDLNVDYKKLAEELFAIKRIGRPGH